MFASLARDLDAVILSLGEVIVHDKCLGTDRCLTRPVSYRESDAVHAIVVVIVGSGWVLALI